jgi:putative two-component system response regulator
MADDKKIKIYLIDDDDIHLTTAELFLKDEYEVHKAKSGQEALDNITNNKFIPNIILLDLTMPNMTGWEVFKRLRQIDSLKNVPIAFVTSIAEAEEKKKAFKMGIADYILKPFNMTELKGKVKDIRKKFKI